MRDSWSCVRLGPMPAVRVQLLLTLGQGFASNPLASEMGEDRVNYQNLDVLFLADLGCMIHCQYLVVAVIDAATDDAFKDLVRLKLLA